MDALTLHRIHFAFAITYHYLFPQLTMGLALLIVVLKTIALRNNDELFSVAAQFGAHIFSINFLLGVVTGFPMEFQFGTNWSAFSRRTGGVIGQPLAMEDVFSFFHAHNMCGAVVTAAFVMSSVGAFYLLQERRGDYGRIFLKVGVIAGVISCIMQIFPTGDLHGKYMAKHQPVPAGDGERFELIKTNRNL